MVPATRQAARVSAFTPRRAALYDTPGTQWGARRSDGNQNVNFTMWRLSGKGDSVTLFVTAGGKTHKVNTVPVGPPSNRTGSGTATFEARGAGGVFTLDLRADTGAVDHRSADLLRLHQARGQRRVRIISVTASGPRPRRPRSARSGTRRGRNRRLHVRDDPHPDGEPTGRALRGVRAATSATRLKRLRLRHRVLRRRGPARAHRPLPAAERRRHARTACARGRRCT